MSKVTEKQTPLNSFITKIAETEGKKKQTPVGDIREVLKAANKLLNGGLYKLIRDNF